MVYSTSPTRNTIPLIWDVIRTALGTWARRLKGSIELNHQQQIIAELRKMEDYELADIGLCRSDLTPVGLAIAAARRKAEQDLCERSSTASHVLPKTEGGPWR
ncbi:MAG: DUF1127 domain-containing protein [Pseudomonadota bacterium]